MHRFEKNCMTQRSHQCVDTIQAHIFYNKMSHTQYVIRIMCMALFNCAIDRRVIERTNKQKNERKRARGKRIIIFRAHKSTTSSRNGKCK